MNSRAMILAPRSTIVPVAIVVLCALPAAYAQQAATVKEIIVAGANSPDSVYAAVDRVSAKQQGMQLSISLRYQVFERRNLGAIDQLFLAAERKVLATIYNGIPGASPGVRNDWSAPRIDLSSLPPGNYTLYACLTSATSDQRGRQHYEQENGGSRVAIGSIVIEQRRARSAPSVDQYWPEVFVHQQEQFRIIKSYPDPAGPTRGRFPKGIRNEAECWIITYWFVWNDESASEGHRPGQQDEEPVKLYIADDGQVVAADTKWHGKWVREEWVERNQQQAGVPEQLRFRIPELRAEDFLPGGRRVIVGFAKNVHTPVVGKQGRDGVLASGDVPAAIAAGNSEIQKLLRAAEEALRPAGSSREPTRQAGGNTRARSWSVQQPSGSAGTLFDDYWVKIEFSNLLLEVPTAEDETKFTVSFDLVVTHKNLGGADVVLGIDDKYLERIYSRFRNERGEERHSQKVRSTHVLPTDGKGTLFLSRLARTGPTGFSEDEARRRYQDRPGGIEIAKMTRNP